MYYWYALKTVPVAHPHQSHHRHLTHHSKPNIPSTDNTGPGREVIKCHLTHCEDDQSLDLWYEQNTNIEPPGQSVDIIMSKVFKAREESLEHLSKHPQITFEILCSMLWIGIGINRICPRNWSTESSINNLGRQSDYGNSKNGLGRPVTEGRLH